jgi:REP element-mobilizing transposase RayT
VSNRACVIKSTWREELQKYMTGIVTRQGQKLIAIYCMPDHTHILLGLKPNAAPSDLIGKIKTGSTNHINEQRWLGCRFSWQEGYGAFSVSHSHLRASLVTFAIKTRAIGGNHFSRNTWNFWNGIRSLMMTITFPSQSNEAAS